jgi:class 3 adenylate cyclase/ActR/RegA family two-component response regulator
MTYMAGKSGGRRTLLAAVLFTDIVDSTRIAAELGDREWELLLDDHDIAIRRLFADFQGTEVKTNGDGFVATFENPAQAVLCALAAIRDVRALGLEVRAGIHCGSIDVRDGDLSGIGVHTAARIVREAPPQEVWVSSTVREIVAGSGLLFEPRGTIALKGVPEPANLFRAIEAPSAAEGRATGARKPAARGRPMTALLVDDHPLWRQTLAATLKQLGTITRTLEAADGVEAVAMAARYQPDVIVIDMDLPGLRGPDAIRQIMRRNPSTRVLVLSASEEESDVLEALRAGALGYLVKTADLVEIEQAIRGIQAGEPVLPPRVSAMVLKELSR